MAYAAVFMGNMGNYYSFGDSKFIPGLPKESFAKLVQLAAEEVAAANKDDDTT
jgi:dipeptidyl-peptidase-3